ncbi:MAG: SpoIVB peptidase S55 domain-containing protein [Vulcanimicrobiota bacterium]
MLGLLLLGLAVPPYGQTFTPRAGQRGYGLTVFSGTTVTRFDVTVLGVARRALRGSDMVLIRIDNSVLNRHHTGVVAGMSGSPVYIDGQLIGAIGYGWTGSQEPIGGVTPLPSMLADLPLAESQTGGRLEQPLRVAGQTYDQVTISPKPDAVGSSTLNLTPVASLVQANGIGPEALRFLSGQLEPLGMQTLAASGSGRRSGAGIPRLVPGSAVGIQLIDGDIDLASTGTLTWRQGDKVLAFGHSLAQLGPVRLPMTAATINTIHPSYERSWKMATQLGLVGEINNDRFHAVAGRLHAPSQMLPATFAISGSPPFRVKVAQHPMLTPGLLATSALEAMATRVTDNEDTTARVSFHFKVEGREPVTLTTMASGKDISKEVAADLSALLSPLVNNPLEPVTLESLSTEIRLEPGRKTARVTRISTDKDRYRPGEVVKLEVELTPFGQRPRLEHFELPIPEDASKGRAKLAVGGGASQSTLLKTVGFSQPAPTSVDSLLDYFKDLSPSNSLVAALGAGPDELAVHGRPLPELPPAQRAWLSSLENRWLTTTHPAIRRARPLDWVIEGSETATIEVLAAPSLAIEPLFEEKKKAATATSKTPAENQLIQLPGGGYRISVNSYEDLRAGELHGLGLEAQGGLSPGVAPSPLGAPLAEVATALISDGQTVDVGWTGGQVWAGHQRLETGQGMVTALLRDGPDLWVATSPGARLLRFREGELAQTVELPSTYVWGLCSAPEGGLLIACGRPGGLYSLKADGKPRLVCPADDQHVSALVRHQQEVYFGTSPAGLLWKLTPAGPSRVGLYQGGIGALTWHADELLVGAGQALYRVDGSRIPLPDASVVALASQGGQVWAATSRGLFRVDPEAGTYRLLSKNPSATLAAETGATLEGSNRLMRWSASSNGTYESKVLDATRQSRWGNLRWQADPPASQMVVRTRSGPTPQPDSSWSDWSSPLLAASGSPITSPPARYLQLQAQLTQGALESFDVTFKPERGQPRATFVEPAGGECWGGVRTIRWKLEQGSAEGLSYRLEASLDGRDWRSLGAPRPVEDRDPEFRWATASLADGSYQLRLTLFEGQEQLAQSLSKRVYVSNTPPQVAWLGGGKGVATTRGPVAIVEVLYRARGQRWQLARARDGLFDSSREEFLVPLPSGTEVELEIRDETGQKTTLSRQI